MYILIQMQNQALQSAILETVFSGTYTGIFRVIWQSTENTDLARSNVIRV